MIQLNPVWLKLELRAGNTCIKVELLSRYISRRDTFKFYFQVSQQRPNSRPDAGEHVHQHPGHSQDPLPLQDHQVFASLVLQEPVQVSQEGLQNHAAHSVPVWSVRQADPPPHDEWSLHHMRGASKKSKTKSNVLEVFGSSTGWMLGHCGLDYG